jgi:hypothetical protein
MTILNPRARRAHQRDRRRKPEAVLRFGGAFGSDGGGAVGDIGVGQQLGVDFADRHFAATVADLRRGTRRLFGLDPLFRAGTRQRAEHLARPMRVAQQQRVETVE